MKDPCTGTLGYVETDVGKGVLTWEITCSCGEHITTMSFGADNPAEAAEGLEELQMLHRAGVSMEEYCGFTMAGGEDRDLTTEELALVNARLETYL